MRLATCVIGVALLLAVRPQVAAADDATQSTAFRAVIDRVDLEPAKLGGYKLRIGLSALSIQGQLLDLTDPKAIKAMVGASKLDAPFALGRYAATDADTAIIIAIEANLAFTEALPNVLTALDDAVISKLGDRTQLAILPYGESSATEKKLVSLKQGRGKLSSVTSDGSASEPAMLDTLEGALRLLKRAKTSPEGLPLRKMIVVISDGRDRSGDRDRVTRLGQRADKEGVRIHTFGYAPSKVLRPLLTLGELSKRSLGTFRWVRSGGVESWAPAFQQLNDEIAKQYVLTYFVPDAELAGKKLKIVTVGRTETTSNEVKIPDALCGGEACAGYCASAVCVVPRESASRGAFGWIALLIGVGLALVVMLGLIGFALSRRQQSAAPAVPGQPGVPGSVPPGTKPAKASKPPKNKPSKPPPGQPAPVAPQAGGPCLLIISGPRAGERVALSNGFLIGKAPTSNLVIDDGYASTQHAQIAIDQFGNCRLYDRGSTNGTFANGVRVSDVVLDHGMTVRIGSTELRFLAQ